MNRFRKISHQILIPIILLLQERMSSNNIPFERPSRVLKIDVNIFWLDIVLCLHIK